MSTKKLLIIPSDVSTLISAGTVSVNKVNNIAIAKVTKSIPIVNDAILSSPAHISMEAEQSSTVLKANMTSAGKNILIDIGAGDDIISEILSITAIDDTALAIAITDYIKSKNQLLYMASVKSPQTNNVMDIYYHISDKCIYVTPELSNLGSPIILSGAVVEMDIYRVAPLEFGATLSSLAFHDTSKYYALNFSETYGAASSGLADSRTDVSIHTMMLQGLSRYSLKSEYSRNTVDKVGTANSVYTDGLVSIVVLEELASTLLVDNTKVNHGLIMQVSPGSWGLRATGKTILNKIAFPIHF